MIYAIGDIHGEIKLLNKLFDEILSDIRHQHDSDNKIIFLGDYVDRGDSSKEVIDFLMDVQQKQDQYFKNLDWFNKLDIIFLWGNHEDMMSKVIDGDEKMVGTWLYNGGLQTLKSFGLYDRTSNPNELFADFDSLKPYNDWFKENLKLYHVTEDYIFCHSGFIRTDFDISLDAQETSLLWGRPHKGMYIGYNKTVIYGHTPTNNGIPSIATNQICVDVGCGKFNDSLACVVLPNTSGELIQPRFMQVYGDSGNKSFI